MKKRLPSMFLIPMLALVLAASTALAGRPVDETRSAARDGIVDISNMNGSVTVTGWDKAEVHVTGSLGDGPDRLSVTSSDKRTVVEVEWPHSVRSSSREPTHLDVSVPRGSQVRVDGVNLWVEVSDVAGDLDLQTVNGSIKVAGKPGEVKAQTVNGEIDVDGASGRVDVETVNGGLRLRGVSGDLSAQSVSGGISVEGGSFTRAEISTVSGGLEFTGELTPKGSYDFESHSGSVILRFPGLDSAEFDVSTFSGDIVNELGPPAKKTSDYAPGKELEFTIGSGGAKINASSFSGTVKLMKP